MADTDWGAFTDVTSLLGTDVLVAARAGGGINFPASAILFKGADGAFDTPRLSLQNSGGVSVDLKDTAAPANQKYWRAASVGGQFSIQTVNDAYTAATVRLSITNSGQVVVGAVSVDAFFDGLLNVSGRTHIRTDADACLYLWDAVTSGNSVFANFGTDATFTGRGSITFNRGSGLTAYNTTSDYRAKDVLGPIEGVGDIIGALRPIMGRMKGASHARPMFVAHEVEEVAPYAVTGDKDAVDDAGKPVMQQMDASALIPLVVAALQEAMKRIEALEAAGQ